MHVAIWRFTTAIPDEFETHYGPDGTWARLFRKDPGYVRTDLLRDGNTYVTLDWWTSREAYDAFRAQHASEYAELDAICEALTETEEKTGAFDVVERPG